MRPVRNSDGVIVNAAKLRVSQVVGQRVSCPGCGAKDFARWPDGWDAHAAHKCAGLENETEVERKAEFKALLRALFRD